MWTFWDSEIPAADVVIYPWDTTGYTPRTEARIYCTNAALHVLFRAFETSVRATYTRPGDPVCRDSCVELFINPKPESDPRYVNIEINPLGTPLVKIGTSRVDRENLSDEAAEFFGVTPLRGQSDWSVEYTIPKPFLERHYGPLSFAPGNKMIGNFYKCGDETPQPHFGCWNPVTGQVPDFHRPKDFGQLLLG